MVATDTRLEDHPIVEEAAEIARNNGGSLKIVDVVPAFSWTVRLSLKDHEHMRELIGQDSNCVAPYITRPRLEVTMRIFEFRRREALN